MQAAVRDNVVCVAGAASALFVASTAMGETATGELEVKAGIENSVTVVCTDALSFGATAFNGDTAMASDMEVSVDENGNLSAPDAPELIALGTDRAQAGECTLFNATGLSESDLSVVYPNLPETGGVPLSGEDVLGLDPGSQPTNDLTVDLDAPPNIGAELNSEGEATFKVTGTLTIPKNAPADPGGYATTITVEVNDST